MGRLLIAGIDPGTVGAYALIDTEGNVIDLSSRRGMDHKKIQLEILKYGKVFLVGCDVNKCPGTVAKVARSLGARVVSPDHDLNYLEKIKIVDNFLKTKKDYININNKHEKDALAAALYGLKRINGLIKKIKDHLKEKNKMELFDEVKKRVLVDEIPITKAVSMC